MSLDTPEKNAEFAESMGAKLPVVSDPKGEVAQRFGVLGLAGLFAKRWTFYIDSQGIVRAIDKQVDPSTAGRDIVWTLEAHGFQKNSSSTDAKP